MIAQKNDCLISSDTLVVTFDSIPFFTKYLVNNTLICDKVPFELKFEAENYSHVLWSNDSRSNTTSINSADNYWVEVYNHCGYIRDEVKINTENCNCYFFAPNSFTPNQDEINDYYSLKMDCEPDYFEWEIFDRWGSRVYYSTNYNSFWDGKYKDNYCPIGSYLNKVKIKYKHSPEEILIREFNILK